MHPYVCVSLCCSYSLLHLAAGLDHASCLEQLLASASPTSTASDSKPAPRRAAAAGGGAAGAGQNSSSGDVDGGSKSNDQGSGHSSAAAHMNLAVEGLTPIHAAAMVGSLRCAEVLLKHGAGMGFGGACMSAVGPEHVRRVFCGSTCLMPMWPFLLVHALCAFRGEERVCMSECVCGRTILRVLAFEAKKVRSVLRC